MEHATYIQAQSHQAQVTRQIAKMQDDALWLMFNRQPTAEELLAMACQRSRDLETLLNDARFRTVSGAGLSPICKLRDKAGAIS